MQLDLSMQPPDLNSDDKLNFTWHVKSVHEERINLNLLFNCTFCVSISEIDTLNLDGKMLDAPAFKEAI